MAIRPIDLPSGAGLDYSGNDVRHFAQGDAVNVPGMSNPTRNLAARDNALAAKLNEVVSVVNNQEQFIPLPVIRTTVPPGEEIIVTNYRIPAGFEARVLNAVISTTPSSTSAQLNVQYSTTYGGMSGTAVVTVTPGSEFSGDVNFYQTGEFIVSLKNTGEATLELAASLMLTMRPLGAEGTLLVGSVIEGKPGKVGATGPPGPIGPPGTGGAGSPGMVWRGNWAENVSYYPSDVVSYTYSGTYGSWICRAAHFSNLGFNDPQTDLATWQHVAFGVIGDTGLTGPTGPAGVVTEMTGATTSVNGTFRPEAGYVGHVFTDGPWSYTGQVAPLPQYYVGLIQTYYGSTGGNPGTQRGIAAINGVFFAAFAGTATITLPKTLYGAAADYTNAFINCMVVPQGTNWVYMTGSGTFSTTFELRKPDQYTYEVKTTTDAPILSAIHLMGVQPVFN